MHPSPLVDVYLLPVHCAAACVPPLSDLCRSGCRWLDRMAPRPAFASRWKGALC